MKASQISDAQKLDLPEGRKPLAARKVSAKQSPKCSQATFFNWKKKYAGLLPPGMKKLKQLEDEKARLTLARAICDATDGLASSWGSLPQ
ncbi:putative transposase [Ensifer sp. 4252]